MGAQPKVNIRLFTKEDLRDVHRYIRKPQVLRGTLQIPSLEIGWMMARWLAESESRFTLVAEVSDGPSRGRVIGSISLNRGTGRRSHVAGLGMTVDPDFHGRGVGTRLMEAALDMADKYWRPLRMELEVYPDNEPALRLYRKFGFQVEGHKTDMAIREGEYVDSLVMSRLNLSGLAPSQDAPLSERSGEATGAQPEGKAPVQGQPESAHEFACDEFAWDVRPPEPGDAPALHRFYSNEGVLQNSMFLPWTVPSVSKIASELESVPSQAVRHTFVAAAGGEIYGEVALEPGRGRLSRGGKVTLMTVPPESLASRRQGTSRASACIAAGLLDAILNLADNWLMLHRLELETYPDEQWLFPALESAGFVREATARMSCLRDGAYEDRLIWGRTMG